MDFNRHVNSYTSQNTEEDNYEDPNSSKSKDSSNYFLFCSQENHKVGLDIKDYYIPPSKNSKSKYSLDVITSKLKPYVNYKNKDHEFGEIKFVKKNCHSQKFPLYHDKNIKLNFQGLNDLFYSSECDMDSDWGTISKGIHNCNFDLKKGIEEFKKHQLFVCENYWKYRKHINFDNNEQENNSNINSDNDNGLRSSEEIFDFSLFDNN